MYRKVKPLKLLILTVVTVTLLIGLFSLTFGETYGFGGGTDLCQDLCPNDPDYCEIQCNDNTGECILICYYSLN